MTIVFFEENHGNFKLFNWKQLVQCIYTGLSTIGLLHSPFCVIYIAAKALGSAILEPITSPEWSHGSANQESWLPWR